jgi:hypothetical protein
MDADTKRRQEHFNIVWQRFVVEGAPQSVDEDSGNCLYEGRDGTTCAFGALLADEERQQANEGTWATDVIEYLQLRRFYDSRGHVDPFYDSLQSCHDECTDCENFSEHVTDALLQLAAEHCLTVPEVTR